MFVHDWEFAVRDASCNTILWISVLPCQFGPNCICDEWQADIMTASRQRVGSIKNCYPGCGVRMCTKADNFEVNWDVSSVFSPVAKALTIGAMVLIDYVLFESRHHAGHEAGGALDAARLLG